MDLPDVMVADAAFEMYQQAFPDHGLEDWWRESVDERSAWCASAERVLAAALAGAAVVEQRFTDGELVVRLMRRYVITTATEVVE